MNIKLTLKIVATILFLTIAGFLENAVFAPISTVAANHATVATVNGGDTAYVVQQSLLMSAPLGIVIAMMAFSVLYVLWYTEISNLFKSKNKE
jgi:hypothetical protein